METPETYGVENYDDEYGEEEYPGGGSVETAYYFVNGESKIFLEPDDAFNQYEAYCLMDECDLDDEMVDRPSIFVHCEDGVYRPFELYAEFLMEDSGSQVPGDFLYEKYHGNVQEALKAMGVENGRAEDLYMGYDKHLYLRDQGKRRKCPLKELESYAKQYVIGQDEAVDTICSAINFFQTGLEFNKSHEDMKVPKSNALIQGGSGTGKTFSIQVIAKKAGIPLVIIDASKLVPTAYRGLRIVDSLAMALKQLAGDYTGGDESEAVEIFNRGFILVFDEADKMLAPDDHFPEYSLRAQGDLLKMMEGAEYDLSDSDLLSRRCTVNTENVLFILAGAFASCEKLKRTALEKEGNKEAARKSQENERKRQMLEWVKESLLQQREEAIRANEKTKKELQAKICELELEKMDNMEKAKAAAQPRIDLVEKIDEKLKEISEQQGPEDKHIGFINEEEKDDSSPENSLKDMVKDRNDHVEVLDRLQKSLNDVNRAIDLEIKKHELAIMQIPEPEEDEKLSLVDQELLALKREMLDEGQPSEVDTKGESTLTVDDLVKYYSLMPEIAGRLQVVCHMKPLDEKDLLHILTRSKSSVLSSYKELFSEKGWKLNFRRNALEALAQEAYRKNTGARGIQSSLNSIIFRILKDVEGKRDMEIIVNKECIIEGKAPEIRDLAPKISEKKAVGY